MSFQVNELSIKDWTIQGETDFVVQSSDGKYALTVPSTLNVLEFLPTNLEYNVAKNSSVYCYQMDVCHIWLDIELELFTAFNSLVVPLPINAKFDVVSNVVISDPHDATFRSNMSTCSISSGSNDIKIYSRIFDPSFKPKLRIQSNFQFITEA